MFWVFEYGEEEEGLTRAIDELHDWLNFETESVASEVPSKGVLQVHQKVSPQPTKKEEVRFLFRGSGVFWECNVAALL